MLAILTTAGDRPVRDVQLPKNVLNPILLLLMIPFTLPMVGVLRDDPRLYPPVRRTHPGRERPTARTTTRVGLIGIRWEIGEGLGRWVWAGLTGFFARWPARRLLIWINCGEVDTIDGFIFADLTLIGAAYALMAVAAALLRENLIAANPYTVLQGIGRVGWDFVSPCLVGAFALGTSFGAWRYVLFHAPNVLVGLAGIWGCWVWTIYQLMIVFRALGLTYYRNADRLDWFRKPLRWGI